MLEADFPAIEVLENSDLTTERESGRTHTPYETEQLFYGCIRSGDVARTGAASEIGKRRIAR